MFDLEQAIADWRKEMLAAGIKSPTPLEELELHLREEIERQIKTGRSGETAFTSAVQNIGPAHKVQREFQKIGTLNKGLNWKLFAILLPTYMALYPVLVGSLVFIFKNGVFSEMTTRQQILSLVAAVVFSLIAWATRWSFGKFPFLRIHRVRDVLFVPVMLWLVAFAYLIMPHVSLAENQKAVLSLWGFAPFGIVLGWIWGFANGAHNKSAKASV